MKIKKCSACKIDKAFFKFHKDKGKKSGLSTQCKRCSVDRAKAWAKNNPDRAKKNSHKANKERHGIAYSQYEDMLQARMGMCDICRRVHKNLCIDHDHRCCSGSFSCGKCIRGLLCRECNTALGLLKENIDTVENMKKYLGA